MALTVGQLAKLAGLTVRALHHYDRIGLLVPRQRTAGGYRQYNDADVVRLYRILALRRLGVPLADVDAALRRGSNALPRIVDRQLAELDARIVAAQRLRERLRRLQAHMQQGGQPASGDWLRALEQLALYEAHCTPEELERLLAHDNEADWPPFVAEARAALHAGVAPGSAPGRALATRWAQLTHARFGGDPALAKKVKSAYLARQGAQRGVTDIRDHAIDRPLLEYLNRLVLELHDHAWRVRIGARRARGLHLAGPWADGWSAFASELRAAHADAARGGESRRASARLRRLRARFDALLDDLCAGNTALRGHVEDALAVDATLRLLWSLDEPLVNFLRSLPRGSAAAAVKSRISA